MRICGTDPCDNHSTACSNCLQLLPCFRNSLAMFDPSFSELAQLIDCVADLAFLVTLSCMFATHPPATGSGYCSNILFLRKFVDFEGS